MLTAPATTASPPPLTVCMSSHGAFTHTSFYQDTHVFSFDIPTAGVPRDIEIVVPLSEITNDGRIAIVQATAGSVTNQITIDN